MVRRVEPQVEIWVPKSVASWVRAMSERVGAPAHTVVHVLLDRYIQRLPAETRAKVEDRLRQWRNRRTH